MDTVPHLEPCKTGQAPCRVVESASPFLYKFHQKAAEPRRGQQVTPARGKTVAPPASTSVNYIHDNFTSKSVFQSCWLLLLSPRIRVIG